MCSLHEQIWEYLHILKGKVGLCRETYAWFTVVLHFYLFYSFELHNY